MSSGNSFHPRVRAGQIGWISREEMVEVDRVMIDELGITLLQMMENAGRSLARLALDLWKPASVVVLAGSGGNGGGGLVAARHLHNAGVAVTVITTKDPADLSEAPRHQAGILERMGVEVDSVSGVGNGAAGHADLILDAVLGYSLDGEPRGRAAELIDGANDSATDVLSLDTPSGLDVTTGEAPGACVRASATLTLAQPKSGLRRASQVGSLLVADISVPPSVLEGLGSLPPDFAAGPILHVVP